MKELMIVMIDEDEYYLNALKKKFEDELKDHADIAIISHQDDLNSFLNEQRDIDKLILDESLLVQKILDYPIKNIYILVEEMKSKVALPNNCTYVEKYTSVNKIYNEVFFSDVERTVPKIQVEKREKLCKVVSIYSPIGGCGKTTIAAGVCIQLASSGKDVLYIGMDELQAFGFMLENEIFLPDGFERLLQEELEEEDLKEVIIHGAFDIFPPFSKPLSMYPIPETELADLVQCIQNLNMYDFIVVDLPSELTGLSNRIMKDSQDILLPMLQDPISIYKIKQYLRIGRFLEKKNCLAVCNQFRPNEENYIIKEQDLNEISVNTYIPYIRNLSGNFIKKLEQSEELHELAHMLL